jgi:hypothetical protein
MRRVLGLSLGVIVGTLFVTTIFVKSMGSIALLTIGAAVLALTRRSRGHLLLICLAIAPSAYILSRIAFGWRGDALVDVAGSIDVDREDSLKMRVDTDAQLIERDAATAFRMGRLGALPRAWLSPTVSGRSSWGPTDWWGSAGSSGRCSPGAVG